MDEALSLLMERFPTLGLMAPQFGIATPPDETLPPFSLDNLDILYIYGLGKGEAYFRVETWLHADPSRRLVFLEDEPGIIGSFLQIPHAAAVLADPQVHLELLSLTSLDSLSSRFPQSRVELVSLPSKKRGRKLRIDLLRKTTISSSLAYDRIHGHALFKNFLANVQRLPHSFYANGLKNAFVGVPAVVCGAGPSLAPTIETLRGLKNRALIIAGGSTLAALSSRGIRPHFGMALDPNEEEYLRMRNSFAFEMPLLYSTRVHPGTFQTMNGPFGYMRTGIGGLAELWIEEELGLEEPLLADFSQEALSVTAICIGWAEFLGCNPILLNGIDLAYTGRQRYSPGVAKEMPFQQFDGRRVVADRIIRRKGRNGKRVDTAIRWVMESAAISDFAKRHPHVRFVNTTEGGIGFKGIEYVPFDEATRGFEERELRVFEKVCGSRMPERAVEIVEREVRELKESLGRVIACLRILSGEKKGAKALAELEMKEEIAYIVLFCGLERAIAPGDWKEWLQFALKYQSVYNSSLSQPQKELL